MDTVKKYLKDFYGFYKCAFVVFFIVAFAQSWACYAMSQSSIKALTLGLIYSLLTGVVAGVTWPVLVIVAIVYTVQSLIVFMI